MPRKIIPRDHEIFLKEHDLIVSKTCLKGNVTYANRKFMNISGFSEQEMLGQPHSLIRHPDMPKGVFRMMWNELKKGNEFLGFVKNLSADGAFYWVFANITPDVDLNGTVKGFYSVRRKPSPETVKQVIEPLYRKMRQIEASGHGRQGIEQSIQEVQKWLDEIGMDYSQAILQLYQTGTLED